MKPVARITAITHRKKPIFQGLLTGKPVTENHILKQIPFEASFLKTLKRQFPTIESVSVRASAGVSFYVVISMTPRFAGEARQVILAAMSSNIRPKWVVIVDPDIDVHSSAEVEWAMAFRVQPQQGCHHRRRHSRRPVRSVDRGPDAGAAHAHRLRHRRRRHAAVRQAVLRSRRCARLGRFRGAGTGRPPIGGRRNKGTVVRCQYVKKDT